MKSLALILAVFVLAGYVFSTDVVNNLSECQTLLNDTVYTMNQSVVPLESYDCFEITGVPGECDACGANITLDCNGFSITGNDTNYYAVFIYSGFNVTVKNCIINGTVSGIEADQSSKQLFSNNTIYPNLAWAYEGIGLYDTTTATIVGNTIYGNLARKIDSEAAYAGILLDGSDTDDHSYNNTIFNNTILTQTNITGIYISVNSVNNTFYWNNLSGSGTYVDDASTRQNFYNTTMSGHGEGNLWANAVSGAIPITATQKSLYGHYFGYGNGGSGYPYNSTNSQGKFVGRWADNAPLVYGYLYVYSNGQYLGRIQETGNGSYSLSNITSTLSPSTTITYVPDILGIINISQSTIFYVWHNDTIPYTVTSTTITPGTDGIFGFTYMYIAPMPLYMILLFLLPLLIAIALLYKVMEG